MRIIKFQLIKRKVRKFTFIIKAQGFVNFAAKLNLHFNQIIT